MINTRLLKLKLYYFNVVGSLIMLKYTVPLYMKQLGLGPNQIGTLLGTKHISGMFIAIVIGVIVDRFRIRKFCFIISAAVIITTLLVLAFAFHQTSVEQCENVLHRFNETFSAYCQRNKMCTHDSFIAQDQSWLYNSHEVEQLVYKFYIAYVPTEAFLLSMFAIADTCTIIELEGEVHKLPYQRSFGALGCGAIYLGITLVISMSETTDTYCGIKVTNTNFTFMFLSLAVIIVLNIPLIISFKTEQLNTSENTNKVVWSSFNTFWEDGRHIILMLVTPLLGMCYGFRMAFGIWKVQNIGASDILIGSEICIHGVTEFIVGIFTSRLIKTFGYTKLIVLGMCCYTLELIGYGSMRRPIWTLLVGACDGMAFLFTFLVGLSYIGLVSSPRCLSTVTFMYNACYISLGRGIGAYVGGALIGRYGDVATFYIFAVFSLLIVAIFGTVHLLYIYQEKQDKGLIDNGIRPNEDQQLALINGQNNSSNSNTAEYYGSQDTETGNE